MKFKFPENLLDKEYFLISFWSWTRQKTLLMSVKAHKTRKHHYFKIKIDGDGAEKTLDSVACFEKYMTELSARNETYEF